MPYKVFNQRLELLSKDQVETIKGGAFQILEEVGFAYRHRRALRILEKNGATVDYKKEIAKIPRDLILECIKNSPKDYTMYSTSGATVNFGDGKLKATMCLEIQIVDYRTMERRPGKTEDCVRSIVVGNELDNVSIVSPFVVPSDVPASVADVRGYKLLFTYSRKPGYHWIFSTESCKYILEMAKVVAGGEEELRKKKIIDYGAEPTSPLQLSHHAIGILIEMAKYGLPISAVGSMTLLGGTGPVTLAGSLSLQTAEVLAGITLVHLLDPSAPVSFCASIQVLDQKTVLCTFGAPENTLGSLAGIQVAKSLGLPCLANVALCDANSPDFQAGFEKAMSVALVMAAGAEGIGHQGIVGADQGSSLEQLIIDDEWLNCINRLLTGFKVSQDALAVEIIKKVGIGGSFLAEPHTLKNMRKEVWYPRLFNRYDWGTWASKGHRDILKRSQEDLDKLLKEHYPQPPIIDKGLEKQLYKIEKEAIHALV